MIDTGLNEPNPNSDEIKIDQHCDNDDYVS